MVKCNVRSRTARILFFIVGIVLLALLYLTLSTSLPKYAGRVPFLALLFIIDWMIYSELKNNWTKSSQLLRCSFALFWWAPIVLLFLFLTATAFYPLQQWNSWLRIYIPGFALIAFISKFFTFLGLIPVYFLRLIAWVRGIGRNLKISKFNRSISFFRGAAIGIGMIVMVVLLMGSVFWVYDFKVQNVQVRIKELPAAFENMRIVQLSDIHIGSWVSKRPLQRAVDEITALKPDLIVFTGDMVNYSSAEVQGFEQIFAQLHAPLGVYAILGNHDYGDYVAWGSKDEKDKNLADLVTFYQSIGWHLLRNESQLIVKDSARLLLAGVENWSATARFHKYGDMKKTLEGAPKADLNILLSHDPTHWDAEVTSLYPEFVLTLSGHTHGMQLGMETRGIKWSPAEYIYREWAGLYSEINQSGSISYLYVNRGLGHIGYPGRVGIRPEITLFTLSRKGI